MLFFRPIIIVMKISRFLQRPQEQGRGNQLIHRRLTKQNVICSLNNSVFYFHYVDSFYGVFGEMVGVLWSVVRLNSKLSALLRLIRIGLHRYNYKTSEYMNKLISFNLKLRNCDNLLFNGL